MHSARARTSVLALIGALIVLALATPASALAASPPTGPTGIALDGRVDLAWQPATGATAYAVYRGTTATTITTRVSPAGGVTGTSYSDTGLADGTTYYYAVRAIESGIESSNSLVVQAAPAARSCSSGSPVVLENCYPGSAAWPVKAPAQASSSGIEGYATAQSVNAGGSVALKVDTGGAATFDIQVYRMGNYGGLGARLFSTIRGVSGVAQPACSNDASTGLVSCSNWSVSTTLSTTSSWPSGMYLLRLVRSNNADTHILLTVRNDARQPQIVFGSGYSTFQAYNSYGGRSLYDFNSGGANTVGASPRAVKVSFDRPYNQIRARQHDWFTEIEQPLVQWLERQGYDVGYIAGTDLERHPELASQGNAYISPGHDEYISTNVRNALESARASGVSLLFTGANALFWRVRYEPSPQNGAQDRVLVCYKTTQAGAADPVSPTTTWRDPAGANKPENALLGAMYIGQQVNQSFPIRVTADQGQDRLYRYTGLDTLTPGSSANLGSDLLGWEWDARVSNGAEPPGVKTLAASPASGDILQDAGAVYSTGSAQSNVTKYKAASGALVVDFGTNQWWRGLATNTFGDGDPVDEIEQMTTNTLVDMGATPATPGANIKLDTPVDPVKVPAGVAASPAGTDSITVSWNPVSGATGYSLYRVRTARDGGYPLGARVNAANITGTSFTDVGLSSGTTYYYVVTATVGGVQSAPSSEATATTPSSSVAPIRINAGGTAYTAVSGAAFTADQLFTGGTTSSIPQTISGTNDSPLYQNERWGDFTYNIPVTNGNYDVRLHFAETWFGTAVTGGNGKRVFGMDVTDTTANPDLPNIDIYAAVGPRAAYVRTIPQVKITDGTLNLRTVRGAADDPEVTAIEVIPAAPSGPPTITGKSPADGATAVVNTVRPSASFSRDMDASTVTASTFTLERASDSAPVAATVAYNAASQTATLTPSAALAFNTTYRARLSTAVKSADGVPLANAIAWTFTTGAPPPAPTVTATTPVNGAATVARATTPTATFSRDMDAATLTASSFTLKTAGGTSVPGTVSYSSATDVATLTPSSALAYSTTYTARLESTIKAADGIALDAPVTWTFTTVDPPPPDTTAPTVSVTAPAAGATIQGTTTLTATAADNVGVAGVQFKLDGNPLGAERTSAPYQFSWDSFGTPNGPHTLTATAKDDAGNTTTSASVAITVNNPAVDPTGMVGAWGFDEASGTTVTDASSAHNNGTITGATRTAAGKFGSALTFAGTNWVTIPASASLDLGGAMTLESWVNPSTLSDWHTVMLRERSGAMAYGLYANNDASRASGHVSTAGTEVHTSGTSQLPLNTWTHLAVTYDGATLKLYQGGVLVSSRAVTGNIDTSTLPLRIGGNNVWGEHFRGALDEMRVYNRALSQAQIQTDMITPVTSADVTPPSTPTGLTATGGTGTASLSWTASTDSGGVAHYDVHRSATSGFTPSAANRVGQPTGTSFSDTGLATGTWFYKVIAVDGAGNSSAASAQAQATVTGDVTAPTVSLTAPAAGATVGGSVSVSASASDNVGVTGVQFRLDGANLGAEDTSSPYAVTWDTRTASNGTHTLTAIARDAGGNTTTASSVSVTVDNGSPPTVSITSPAAGATVVGTTTLTANAADDRGVASVQFKVGGADIGAADTSPPYSVSWDSKTVVNGSQSLTAVARDTDGNTVTSAAVGVTVNNPNTTPPGLVAAYGFEESSGTTAADASGSGLTGTLTNGPVSVAAGKVGRGLSFDGVNDLVSVPDAPALRPTTGISMEAWVNPTAVTGWRTVMLKGQSAADMSFSIYANTNTDRPSGHVFTNAEFDTRGTAQVPANAWTHLAMTYDGATLRLYVNGAQASSKAVTGSITNGARALEIGGNSIWGEWFKGTLDEVRVYNRALTTPEIQGDLTRAVP